MGVLLLWDVLLILDNVKDVAWRDCHAEKVDLSEIERGRYVCVLSLYCFRSA